MNRVMGVFREIDPNDRWTLLNAAREAGDGYAAGKLHALFEELDKVPCKCRHPAKRHNAWDDEGYLACDVEACQCKHFEVLR